MTTTRHTPIPTSPKTAANAATLNAPLSQLDTAIVAVEGDVTTLFSSVGSGAGWASSLDGTASSGQKVVPVASTTGAVAGMPVYLGLTSGTHEVGVIDTVSAGVSVTLVANLASTYAAGTPISATPAEVADARGGYATLKKKVQAYAFDPVDYGADPTGAADSTAAIEAASVDAAIVKGTIQLPPGTFLVSWADITNTAGFHAGVALRTGCSLRGAGIGATTIKLAASQLDVNAGIVRNWNLNGGDEDITISDLTIDGNGANEAYLYQGIDLLRARNVHHDRVRVLNVRGTASYPPGETFHFTSNGCTDLYYTDCEALGTAGTQGSGFASNGSTNVIRVNCLARGMSAGMGYADWSSRGVLLTNCVAQLNGANGFNAEICEDVAYVNCRSGGRASGGTPYPFTADQSLGNSTGFVVNDTASSVLNGCVSSYNADNGLSIVKTAGPASSAQVIGGRYSDNTNAGIHADADSMLVSRISRTTITPNNGYDFALAGVTLGPDFLPAPAMPATTVPVTNIYPFPVNVHIEYGGTVYSVTVNGTAYSGPGAAVGGSWAVPAGGTISLSYTGAPGWIWMRA